MAKFCRLCGSPLEEGANFCEGCGAVVKTSTVPAPEAPADPETQEDPEIPEDPEDPTATEELTESETPAEPGTQAEPEAFVPPGQPQPLYGQQAPPPGQPAYAPEYEPPQKKKFPKALLILIIIAAVIVAGIVAGKLATGNVAAQEYFKLGPDQVPSVKLILGEERNVTSYNNSTSDGVQTIVIEYKVAENQNTEMQTYALALMDDYGFANTNAYDFSGPTGSGFEFATESVEEGFVVMVKIGYDTNGYTLTLMRGKGTLTLYEEPEDIIEEEEEEADEPGTAPTVAEGTFEVIIPMYYSGVIEGEIDQQAQGMGIDVIINPDGSRVYTMTEEQQEQFLAEFASDLEEMFHNMANDETFIGLSEIRWSNDYSEVELLVNDEFFADDALGFYALISIGFMSPLYQVFQGNPDAKSLVTLMDEETEETVSSFMCPDDIFGLFDDN